MRQAFVVSVLVALAALFGARSSRAFCGFYVSGADGKLFADATQVVLMREGTRTVLSMQNDYKGPPEDFAMVIPVPVILQKENVKTLPRDVFARVDRLSAPRLVEYWEEDPCASGRGEGIGLGNIGGLGHGAGAGYGRGGAASLVKVEAQFEVGEYEIVILSAKDSSALDAWLKENKYKIPNDAEPLLRPYVAAGSKFFVARVNVHKVKMEDGRATLSPLRFHYDSEKFELPVRLGLVNSSGKQDLIVQILAPDTRYVVASYPNATIPTNIDVAETARDRFGEFYAALFDKTLEKNPNAVVTEYAWGASSCDPCPGGLSGLSNGDLVTLGADVLPSIIAKGGPQGGGTGTGPASQIRVGAMTASEGLPPEVIQRIVRQNFGRFRMCYETGLTKNPALSGRVSVKFVIDKRGEVKNVGDGGSDLPDASVVSCVKNAFERLSFPEPEGGKNVTVVYPLVFAPGTVGASVGRGGFGGSNLPNFVLTRLHARYGKDSLANDLVFKAAEPIIGGREIRGANSALEEGATKSSVNNFQARYAIRHAWPGEVKCESPIRGRWGGAWPDVDAGRGAEGALSATNLAYAPRGNVTLTSFVTGGAPAIDHAMGDGGGAAAPDADAGAVDAGDGGTAGAASGAPSRCGCRAVGGEAGARGPLALTAALTLGALVRRRGRRR